MAEFSRKQNVSKVYCGICDTVFESRVEFDRHYSKHGGPVVCESCPIDTAISKFIGLFKKKD